MTGELETPGDEVAVPTPEPAPELVDETTEPEVTPESFDRATRASDQVPDEPQAGELPKPIPNVLTVPELAPQEHHLSEQVQDNLSQLAALSREGGMSFDEAQTAVGLYYEFEAMLGELRVDQRDPEHQQQTHASLRRLWGTAYESNLADARKAFKALPPSMQRWLDDRGGSDDASVLTILAAKGGGLLNLTPAQCRAEADHMRATNKALRDTSHRDYKANLTRYRILRHLEGRGEGKSDLQQLKADVKSAKAKPDTATKDLDQQLADLRLHPAYADKRHASNKEVWARYWALMEKRWPGVHNPGSA
jgi:hypothetical protein